MRKYLVISDIHSNLEALEAVLKDSLEFGPFDMKLCAGDLVGYGPNPNEVVKIIDEDDFICVLGNHDRAVLGRGMSGFNPQAILAVAHNQEILSAEARRYLQFLSNEPFRDPQGVFALVHGSLNGHREETDDKERYEDMYILYPRQFPQSGLCRLDVQLGIVGHTHSPTLGVMYGGAKPLDFTRPVRMINDDTGRGHDVKLLRRNDGLRAVVNFGSVGQPRDNDPRAAYGIVVITEGSIGLQYRRVSYNVAMTQQKMQEAGLPEYLISRLALGK